MTTFTNIIACWESNADLASDLGIGTAHARTMRERNSIPPIHWPRLVEAASRRGFKGVTHDALAVAYADRFPVKRVSEHAGSAA